MFLHAVHHTKAAEILEESSSAAPEESSSSAPSDESSCVGGDPEMLVTVSGASGTIVFCGETWNLPGDSGQQKTVCPTTYLKSTSTYTSPVGTAAQHVWKFTGTATPVSGGLKLQRAARATPSPNYTNRVQGVSISPTSGFYSRQAWFSGTTGFTYINNANTPKPSVVNVVKPSSLSGGYDLNDAFFGSATISGITYSWAKGNGWPF